MRTILKQYLKLSRINITLRRLSNPRFWPGFATEGRPGRAKSTPLRLAIPIFLGLMTLIGLLPFNSRAANLLTNGGFNNPFNDIPGRVWRDQIEKIADGWTPFYIESGTYPGSGNASKLHWMSDLQFDLELGKPPYEGYHIEGDGSQNMWSSYEFDAGVYQQISGVTRGEGYRFDIKMTTFWRGPGYDDSDGIMVKRVGIDPYGGTDPTSPNIIWSEPDSNDKFWVGMKVAATAETNTITVFAKVQAPENDSSNHTDLDMVYFEDAQVEQTVSGPTTTLNASASGTTVNLNWSGNPTSGWSLKGYEVQYRDQADSEWVTLQAKTGTNTSGNFTGQAGRTYIIIQARTWQTNGDVDLPGLWVEKSVIIGDAVVGQVIDHAGLGLSGVRISVGGTTPSTLSTNGGDYVLSTGAPGTFDIVADNFNDLVAPPSTKVTVPPNNVGRLTITFRPTGTHQAIRNNDFETDLANWNASDGTAISAATNAYHTGNRGLLISNNVNISQTNTVTGMLNPLLSFWYKNDAAFTVELLGETSSQSLGTAGLNPVQTQTLAPVSNWTHFIMMELKANNGYTGQIGVNFSHTGGAANIFIDEVSIAAGPFKTYLPVTIKN